MMTIGEVARWLAVSKRTVESLVAQGGIPSHKIGHRRWITKFELVQFVERCKVYPKPRAALPR